MTTETTPTPRTSRFSVGRVLVVVAVLGITLLWIWIFSGAPARKNPDYLADRAWVARAAKRCDLVTSRIDELPAAQTATNATDRATTIDKANTMLAALVDNLVADRPAGSSDRRVVKLWLDDWGRFLDARVDYARRLRAYDPAEDKAVPRFLLPQNQKGDGIDQPIKAFADVNNIPQCATPGDVG